MRKLGIGFILVILLLSILSIAIVPSNASATTGNITVAPGETKYLSYASAQIDDELLWNIDISYLGWSLTYWLEKPSGAHVAIDYFDNWGKITDAAGVWKIGFNIASGGIWSAYIDYEIYLLSPTVKMTSPTDHGYLNKVSTLVSGTYSDESFLSYLMVSNDNVHFDFAETHLGAWNKQMSFAVGGNTIYIEAGFGWPSGFGYYVLYSWSFQVTVDTTDPELTILTPMADSAIRGTYVSISWDRSDNIGITKTEIKFDALGWNTLGTDSPYNANLATGIHTIQLRVTDMAGNQVVKTVTISVDAEAFSFGGPFYGLPTIGIIAAIILVLLFLFLRYRKHDEAPIEKSPVEVATVAQVKEEPIVEPTSPEEKEEVSDTEEIGMATHCSNCGKKLEPGKKFCKYCGAKSG